MPRERRKVPYKKKPSKAKRKQASGGLDGAGGLPLDPMDASAPVVPARDRDTYVRFAAASLGLAVAVGLAVAGWRFGHMTVGDPPLRGILLAAGLGLAAFLLTSVVMRQAMGRRLLGVTVGGALAASPLMARAVADREVRDSQVLFHAVLDGPQLAIADQTVGFASRQAGRLLDQAERPVPDGAPDTWQAWSPESTGLAPRTYGAFEKGLVVRWDAGPTYAVHAAQQLLPSAMKAGSPAEVRWVALVQHEPTAAGGPRADVRIFDLQDGRLLATATREQGSGTILSKPLADLIAAAACPAYPGVAACG